MLLLIQSFQLRDQFGHERPRLGTGTHHLDLCIQAVWWVVSFTLQETDQNTLRQNFQETKPAPGTASLPNEFSWVPCPLYRAFLSCPFKVPLFVIHIQCMQSLPGPTLPAWLVQFVLVFEHSPGAWPSLQWYVCLCKPVSIFSETTHIQSVSTWSSCTTAAAFSRAAALAKLWAGSCLTICYTNSPKCGSRILWVSETNVRDAVVFKQHTSQQCHHSPRNRSNHLCRMQSHVMYIK